MRAPAGSSPFCGPGLRTILLQPNAGNLERKLAVNEEYILDATIELVLVGPDRYRVRLGASGGEVTASEDQVRLLRQFERWALPEEVLKAHPGDKDASTGFLETCIDEGILLSRLPSGKARLPERRRPATTVFGAPHHRMDAPASFVFLGVPWDGAATGARHGPSVLRDASACCHYEIDPTTLAPCGFVDLAAGKTLLEGSAIADAGDVNFVAGEDPHDAYDRITCVVQELVEAGSTPLIIGGDQSITYPVLRAFQHERLAVVHLDASGDLGPIELSGLCHHNAFSVVLEKLEFVERVHQIGSRGLVPATRAVAEERVGRFGMDRVRSLGPTCLAEALPDDLPYFVSVDVSVLDPSVAPSTGRPVPGGLFPHELKAILNSIATSRQVVGVEVVEVAPPASPADGTAQLGLEILLTVADGVRRVRAG